MITLLFALVMLIVGIHDQNMVLMFGAGGMVGIFLGTLNMGYRMSRVIAPDKTFWQFIAAYNKLAARRRSEGEHERY